ncbi:unnamed protein product [Linum tenue]|uniref:Uncharacterized protein n=1 Tax=Linum tenue TaxID=586396 RepID=A0AAV0ISP7_9ROSI|nr:unnamed protein product [Linum tenue]
MAFPKAMKRQLEMLQMENLSLVYGGNLNGILYIFLLSIRRVRTSSSGGE